MTDAMATITYASVLSWETVKIAQMISALNVLEVKLGNILNAYVQALVTEKVWTMPGPEFGKDSRRSAVIIRALHGLKLAGAASPSHLPGAWNTCGINLVMLTQIYGLNQKLDQKMG